MPTHVIRARAPRGTAGEPFVSRDPDRLASHLQDAAHFPGGHALALALPRTEAEVAAVLSGPAPVLPIGAQSSLTGGATPMGELLLSTAHMTTLSLFPGAIVAQPGATLAALAAALEPTGFWYPPVPTYAGATIGGVVSTNAAGAATFKYGTTREWVDALTVVLAGGEVLDLRRGEVLAHADGFFDVRLKGRTARVDVPPYRMPNVPKVSAGYYAAPRMDLIDLFIGAEGTLGVVTSITLRTTPRRPAIALALVLCPTRSIGLRLVADLRASSQLTWRTGDPRGIDVCGIEHLDRRCLELLRADAVDRACDVTLPDDAELALLLTLELDPGMDSREAYDQIGRAFDGTAPDTALGRCCRMLSAAGLLDRTEMALPGDRARQAQFLALREAVPAAVNQRIGRAQHAVDARIDKVAADVIVPFDRLEWLLDLCDAEFARRHLDGAVWGHISDGNLHPNVMPGSARDLEEGKEAVLAIGRAAIQSGGSPCAEHGVGRNPVKQQLVRELYGAAGVEAMRRVKRTLDPAGKLAPGVLGM